jgi:hypothetical protein
MFLTCHVQKNPSDWLQGLTWAMHYQFTLNTSYASQNTLLHLCWVRLGTKRRDQGMAAQATA